MEISIKQDKYAVEISPQGKEPKKEEKQKQKKFPSVKIPVTRLIDYHLTITDKESHYKKKNENSFISHEPIFNLLTVEASRSRHPFYIIDPFLLYNEGSTSICHKSLAKVQLNQYRKMTDKPWTDKFNANVVMMGIDKKSYFREMDGSWRKTIDFLAYQGLDKDKRIVEPLKALAFPMPNILKYQSLNPHTIIVTQTKTAKTSTISELGYPPFSGMKPTIPGLFGGGMEYKEGAASGWGVLSIDECGKLNMMDDDNRGLLEFCLEYLQKGRMPMIKYGSKDCTGTKTFCLFSNPDTSRNILLPYFIRNLLSKIGALSEQVSSRLGILVFGTDFKQVSSESLYRDADFDRIRLVIKEVWIEQQKKWARLINSFHNWLNERDEAYYNIIKDDIQYNDDDIYRFAINGIGKFHNRSKCAALKLAVINNLDRFYLFNNITELKNELLPEVEQNWEYIKETNLSSIRTISNVPRIDRLAFFDMCDTDKLHLVSRIMDLERSLDVPHQRLGEWISEYKDREFRKNVKTETVGTEKT